MPTARSGTFGRFLAALRGRLRIEPADMPPRAPTDVAYWEFEGAPVELPSVELPRGVREAARELEGSAR